MTAPVAVFLLLSLLVHFVYFPTDDLPNGKKLITWEMLWWLFLNFFFIAAIARAFGKPYSIVAGTDLGFVATLVMGTRVF